MLKNRIFFGVILVAIGVIALSGCRSSRSSRTNARKTPTPAPTAVAPATGPSAQSVMNHADSALMRVSQLSAEDRDAESAPIAEPPSEMRTPWGEPYAQNAPKPNLSDYGVYEAALGAYNGGRYDEAISLFSQIVNTGRPPELVSNAYYWMGESFYATGRYAESMPYFEYVIRVGPEYKREISMFKLSRGGIHLGNSEGANMWYERLRNEYPKSHYISTLRKLGAR